MPRPREFARVRQGPDGRYIIDKSSSLIVPEISIHSKTGQLYRINTEGQRQYLGTDVDKVARLYLSGVTPDASEVARRQLADFGIDPDLITDEVRVRWVQARSHAERLAIVKSLDGTVSDDALDLWETYRDELKHPHRKENEEHVRRHQRIIEILTHPPVDQTGNKGSTLKACARLWKELKAEERCKADYIGDVARIFERRFIQIVGNKRVGDLTADDFAKWRRWVTKTTAETRTGKWHNDQHTAVGAVLRGVRKDKPSWGWSPELDGWLSGWTRQAYIPDKKNRQMLPVDVFHSLLAACGTYADDPQDYDKRNQQGRAMRLQAMRHTVEGQRMSCILKLAINAALDPVDIIRLKWVNLKLDTTVPYMDFPRAKPRRQSGGAVDRLTPLLPSVVSALKEWKSVAGPGEWVFQPAGRGQYSDKGLSDAFKRLWKMAGVADGWTFKHLRNVGPSLGKRHKRPRDERDAILGHTVKGDGGERTSKYYEDDMDHLFLVPLVNLIGVEYFGGEMIPPGSSPGA